MLKKILFFICVITTLYSSTEYEEAYGLYSAGDYASSIVMFENLATTHDDYDAAYILGYMYEHGEGCKIDMQKAIKWYKFASKGYYEQNRYDSTRDVEKEQRKLYNTLEKMDDSQTRMTIRRIAQSLYNVKAYETNYFLPVRYRYNGVYADTNGHKPAEIETEFQVSIKYDFGANFFKLNEVYSVAYTQKSFWQFYAKSAYFRESNYNPKFFVTFPLSQINDPKFVKALRVSFEHQSNGRGGAEERSWNFFAASLYFQYKYLFTEFRVWVRMPDNIDYNPLLLDYLGHGHIRFILPYKDHLARLMLRNNYTSKGAVELDYSYPVYGKDDLFFYIKAFSGYGESLIDYDNYINKVGIGFSISR